MKGGGKVKNRKEGSSIGVRRCDSIPDGGSGCVTDVGGTKIRLWTERGKRGGAPYSLKGKGVPISAMLKGEQNSILQEKRRSRPTWEGGPSVKGGKNP